jgi:putative peptide zinc metalloprotease protein
MSTDLYSPSWYRVAEIRPRLRSHVRIHRHHYRGELWYVLEDRVSRRVHRFNPAAYYIVGLMNGHRTAQEIWNAAAARFGDDAPTQDETIRLLGQLHMAELLQTEVAPDVAELLRRARKGKPKVWLQNLRSPLAMRFPLFDPDRLLERWLPWYRPLFGWGGALLWLAVATAAGLAAAAHWQELTQNFSDRVLAPQNLLLLALIFPAVKLLHEFGHACATKAWGGEVHEMGLMLLVLMPIPYMDASAASAFRETRRRVAVGAAGMLVEVFVASLAMFLWLEAEPGVFRAVLYNVMLIAGVSTVIFNINPLLRFDGYYILADLIQIQNLRQRGQQYLANLVERRVFGVQTPEVEAMPGERGWFIGYTVASFIYRIFIVLAIALFIATEYMIVGVVLALWAVAASVVWPLLKGLGYLFFSARLRRNRLRAALSTSLVAAGAAALLFLVPVPYWTAAEGVISVPDDAHVRAGADGFVRSIDARPAALVRRGSTLLAVEDPELETRIEVLEAQARLLELQVQAELQVDRVRWEMARAALKTAREELEFAQARRKELTIVSPTSGQFVLTGSAQDLLDRYVRKGQEIGYVVPPATVRARVLVAQEDVDYVLSRTERVRVKLAGRLYDTFEARILQAVPMATDQVANPALSTLGGGRAALDPTEAGNSKTLQTWFQFELELPGTPAFVIGEHVYARFEHPPEPIAWRMYRAVRQLFLKQFLV